MKIKKINLYTNSLREQKEFYSNHLGFDLIAESSTSFTVKVGWSELRFSFSQKAHKYHYCFLIPENKLLEALKWLEKRVKIVEVEKGKQIQNFETWNADSFYFYDKAGSIAEFIVRYDLNNVSDKPFDSSSVVCVNEIGMPTKNVSKCNNELEEKMNSKLWRGDLDIFGVNGSQNGLFLLPNYNHKKTWFPTDLRVTPEPFEALIENNNNCFDVCYKNEILQITAIKP